MIVIADAGVLILMHGAGVLHLLQGLYGEVVVTDAVAQECQSVSLAGIPWITVREVDFSMVDARADEWGVDLGEASALEFALSCNGPLLLMDDRGGRRVALSKGLDVIGSLGIALMAKRRGLVPSVKEVVEKYLACDAWLSRRLIRQVLESAGEL